MDTSNSSEVSGLSVINLCDLNLEDAYHRVDFLNDVKSCEAYCDYLENLIYNYTKQNSDELDMQLVNETQHIIIRCARKSNKLLSDELKYYLKQILENVRQKPTSPLPPPSQSNSNRKTKKNKRNLASPIMENSEPKKSKQVTNSDLSDFESMHSASSSSEEESEIETKTSTKLETAQTEENNDSDTENNNGFTVVTRKKRVPPIIIDEIGPNWASLVRFIHSFEPEAQVLQRDLVNY
ncbi:hypothetical protein NPIL_353561 [Nephila pilipes]|uniref:Uncharacterized protein n=1 Tax=Nephila pilipes TaxID=299642 RepID=A0A8X6UDT5_NEPPI|nr:hypothetical protein NPIL_596241 [Nephila pilipes]GFU04374.1 hypothetical protein NPIL_609501 [Nephila pilipes]GFU10312.1 hypothetical protein NPIL_353561 [Nephila pilipes]